MKEFQNLEKQRNHWFINIEDEITTNFLLDILLRIGTYIRAELINDPFLS